METTVKNVIEGLDASVYRPSTNLISSSPPSTYGALTGGVVGSLIGGAKPFQMPQNNTPRSVFISLADAKRNQLNTDKSDEPTSPHLLSKDANTYELEKFNGHRMIIFNHYNFRDGDTRRGTMEDEEALMKTFSSFRFQVETHRDLKKRHLIETIRRFSRTDFSKYGCICVAVLTHGHDRPGYLEAYDHRYSEQEIFKPFDASRNPTLVAKPIIFIIQACRGSSPSVKVNHLKSRSRLQLDISDDWEDYHLPVEADRIVFHSSAAGKASVRHPVHGSWFIQALCKKIQECGHKSDLETIFMLVKREVALDYVTTKDWKQMPVVTSTLIRALYLGGKGHVTPPEEIVDYPSKHSITCEIHQQLDKLKETVSLKEPDESPDSSSTPLKPLHMPCSCFLEYFEYLRKCLEAFVHHNPTDKVASSLLKMMHRVEDGAEYNVQKFSYIQTVWEYFDANMDKFPADGAKFVYRKYH